MKLNHLLRSKRTTNQVAFTATPIFKIFKKSLSIPITVLINMSFRQGKLRQAIKMFFLGFKKDDKLGQNNCRPISLISSVSKLVETLMHKRLYMHLEQNKLFYPC